MADLNTIKDIFDDIKDAINDQGVPVSDCDSPETYASKVRSISVDNSYGVVTINAFCSSETMPSTPTGGGFDGENIIYPDGWTNGAYLTENIWMSTGYYINNSIRWTPPILLNGESGGDIIVESNNNMRTFLIFTAQRVEGENPDPEPSAPIQGGHWDTENNVLEGTITSNNGFFRWSDTNYSIDSDSITWMAQGTFDATGNIIGQWTDPICITGEDGVNGTDGTSKEFIYKKFTTKVVAQQYINDVQQGLIVIPSDHEHADVVPTNLGGHDNPEGISEEYQVELVCTRKFNKTTELGEDWVGPVFWATWGEDGTDGDGVEYIFQVVSSDRCRQNNDGSGELTDSTIFPPMDEEMFIDGLASGVNPTEALYTYRHYSEFVPGTLEPANAMGWNRGWTDDPSDVSENEPLEFVSIRKFRYNDTLGEKVGGWYSKPTLGNKWAYVDTSIFTAFAFTRTNDDLAALGDGLIITGGTPENPIPDNSQYYKPGATEPTVVVGSDTIPSNPGTIGMTKRTFGTSNSEGSSVMRMADSDRFQVEYSVSELPNGTATQLLSLNGYINDSAEGIDEQRWRDDCENAHLGVWDDQVTNPIGMATSSRINGEWTDWSISKIKGEQGDPGDPGRGIDHITITYRGHTSGTTHPAATPAADGSSSIPEAPSNPAYRYLWKKTIVYYTDNTQDDPVYELVSERAFDGGIGPKMRMRNWRTTYTNPDSDGQSGWQCGDNDNDAFYDIAIWPNVEGGIDTNVANSADRLWRCIANLDYADVTEGSTPEDYPNNFSHAVGWDFVATNLLLANRISAEQIDVGGLSVDTLVTTPTTDDPDSFIRAQGNTMTLYKTGSPACMITADALSADASDYYQKVGTGGLGTIADTTGDPNATGVNFSVDLGTVTILAPAQGQAEDVLYSLQPQFIGMKVTGSIITDTTFTANSPATFNSTLEIRAINRKTGAVHHGNQTGYTKGLKYVTDPEQSLTFHAGNVLNEGAVFKINSHYDPANGLNGGVLSPGVYDIKLIGSVGVVGGNRTNVSNFKLEAYQSESNPADPPQDDAIGVNTTGYSPIILHHTSTSNANVTEIANNGFAHVVDANNYFKLLKESDGSLTFEFKTSNTTNTFGLQITSEYGIRKWNQSAIPPDGEQL